MSNGRAKRGGETGGNGEFYAGGTFLPSTELPKGTPAAKKATASKEQIARREWAVAPADGQRAIYAALAGTCCQVIDGQMVVTASDQTLAYYRRTRAAVEALAARWNAGERWASQEDVY